MINDVKILKLITGEEVMARIEQKETMLVLDKPMTLQQLPNPQTGQIGIALVPWFMSGKNENITISIDHVIAQDDPKSQPEKNYLSAVTGLTL